MDKIHLTYMKAAFVEAQKARERGEVPIGAVIVDSETNEILAADGNRTIELSDPTAHAEIQVIRAAGQKLGVQRLNTCNLYVTLEPCPMCAQAISFARINTLIYGASDPKGGGIQQGPAIYQQPTCFHKPHVINGHMEAECGQILKDFFKARR